MVVETLVHGERTNAILGWLTTAVVLLAAIESFLTGAYLWSGLAISIVVVLAVPAVTSGSPTAMVPWPLPAVAAAAVVLRAVEFYPDITGYVAISSIALILVVELDVYTDVQLSRRFAIIFATMTTMALQAVWIIAQFYSDRWLGTVFLQSQTELQWDIVSITVVAIVLGSVFEWYFGRFDPVQSFDRQPSR